MYSDKYNKLQPFTRTVSDVYGESYPSLPIGWEPVAFRPANLGEAWLSLTDHPKISYGITYYPVIILKIVKRPVFTQRATIALSEIYPELTYEGIPQGFRINSKDSFRIPKVGEWYLSTTLSAIKHDDTSRLSGPRLILKKILD